jgi:hypothetical protein
MAGAKTKNGVDKDYGGPITIGGQPLTYSEARLLLAMICNMKFLPEINWDGVAEELSMANAKCESPFLPFFIDCYPSFLSKKCFKFRVWHSLNPLPCPLSPLHLSPDLASKFHTTPR